MLSQFLFISRAGFNFPRETLIFRTKNSKNSDMAPPILSLALPSETGRVLSIQSHTVQGYVGNKSAVFPLQLLGYDVDPINSVQFSNHTGYPTFKGQVLNGQQLWEIISGLEANELLFYTHLLTGYIGSVSFLNTILEVVSKLRTINPELTYEPFIWPPPPVVAGEPILMTVPDEQFSGQLVPENRSSEILDVLEQRFETQIALVERNQQRLQQNTSDIHDLKQAMSRIEASLQNLSGMIDGLSQHGQSDYAGGSISSFRHTENIQFGTFNNSSLYLRSQNEKTLPLIPPFVISHIFEARTNDEFKILKQEEIDSATEEFKIQRDTDHRLEESITSQAMETDLGDTEAMGEVLDITSASITSIKGSHSLRPTGQLEPLLSHALKPNEKKISSYPLSSNSCSMLSTTMLMPQKLIFDLMSLPCSAPFSNTEYKEKPSLPLAFAELNMNAATNFYALIVHRLERNSKFQAKFSSDGDFTWHRWKFRLTVSVKWNDKSVIEEEPGVISAIVTWLTGYWFINVILCIGPKFCLLFFGFKANIVAEKLSSINKLESNGQIHKLEGSSSQVLGHCVGDALQLFSSTVQGAINFGFVPVMLASSTAAYSCDWSKFSIYQDGLPKIIIMVCFPWQQVKSYHKWAQHNCHCDNLS